jgi:hypothetical protein
MKTKLLLIFALVLVISSLSLTSALIINSVEQDPLYPGQETSIKIDVENNLDYDLNDDVTINLIFNSIDPITGQIDLTKPSIFSSVGSSQDTVDGIDEDDSETFSFRVKASNSIQPGDYSLPYQLSYTSKNNSVVTETGTITITINSKTLLDYSIKQDTKILNQKDRLTLRIINKGFGDVKFLTVEVQPQNFVLLSEEKIYIGSISSDDSDSANFEILLNKANPTFTALVTYKDFENNDISETINFDLTAYTNEEALKLGLIKKSYTTLIVAVIAILIVLGLIIRTIRKRRNKAKNNL